MTPPATNRSGEADRILPIDASYLVMKAVIQVLWDFLLFPKFIYVKQEELLREMKPYLGQLFSLNIFCALVKEVLYYSIYQKNEIGQEKEIEKVINKEQNKSKQHSLVFAFFGGLLIENENCKHNGKHDHQEICEN